MLEKIRLKGDKYIELIDMNQLSEEQLNKIRDKAHTKTLSEWRNPDNEESIKVPMSEDQRKHVIATKDYIVNNRTPFQLLEDDVFYISEHFEKRAAWRLENKDPDSPISRKTKLQIAKIFSEATLTHIKTDATWKGRTSLSYNFTGVINHEKVTVSFAFEEEIVWVTVFPNKSKKKNYGTTLGSNIPKETLAKLKKIGK